jgi:hypothetical protein
MSWWKPILIALGKKALELAGEELAKKATKKTK